MFDMRLKSFTNRRNLLAAAAMTLVAGCSVVPKTTAPDLPPEPEPTQSTLPTDTAHHRVALLVPTSGNNAEVGQSIANAATMALLDTNASNLRITTYDTASDPSGATRRALSDGNQLILGPLLSDNIVSVNNVARPAGVPLISFSNDEKMASDNVFVMGNLPGQSVTRTVEYAHSKGISAFAALIPRGDYGERTSSALMSAVRANGGAVIAMESYERSPTSIRAAAARIQSKKGYGALLIADSGSLSAQAATTFKAGEDTASVRLLGTELWGGEKRLATTPALQGAWFATVSDQRFSQFASSYKSRFGAQPYRIATLGYDAVLLTLRVARDWKQGSKFPTASLVSADGFLGLDGPFRFSKGGVVERALEVREVSSGSVRVVSPAPTRFDK
ncbi:penicillin-binding protein activator [Novosphingobium mangrovi (ex Hu et al. 2023)]|uniref:Penicillin-binding protein activator n=1 Tax=Novosphingobium mangrovi (ex Hu et al. 2023) TaxID=2930094 RepID=A0ABT0A9I8_9SPHN|nr:penicillin-binding protein activator [Novosphingobium mangrovi (ex Hu et al. 2023)]MCJ1959847.1 penicillin-binding protein activator [Novosphingobium mangrovi (ex Hu et al. 2023)]